MRGSQIAIEMATAILTVETSDDPLECDRAQMMALDDNKREHNMGGRNKQSIVTEIDAVLEAHRFTTGESK